MPADILRDPRQDTPAAETEAAPQQDVSTQSLLDRIDKSKAAYEATFGTPAEQKAELEAAKRKAEQAEATSEAVWKGVAEPGIVGVIQAARQPFPAVPQALPEPPVPSLKGREYLDVPDKHALGALVTGLGVMAQLAMSGKAPVAALNALTGAMEGWHTGDAERAQRDWRTYVAQVDQIRTENRQNMDRFEAAMQVHGANITAAQADLVASMYEAGHYQQAAAIARQGVIPAYNQMADSMAHTDHLFDQTLKVIQADETLKLRRAIAESAQAQQRQYHEEVRADKERAFNEHIREFNAHQETLRRMQDISALTPEAKSLAAEKYLQTGIMPQMGWGSAARVPIANEAGRLATERGITGSDWVDRTAMNQALQKELNKLTTQRGPLLAFANQGHDHLKVALGLIDKVDSTGVPVLTRWLRAGQKSIEGDPDVTTLDNHVKLAVFEVARVAQSATGSGVASDTARREAQELLYSAMNPGQFKAAAESLDKSLVFRETNINKQIEETRRQISELGRSGVPGSDKQPPLPARELRVRLKSNPSRTGTLKLKEGEDVPSEYEVIP